MLLAPSESDRLLASGELLSSRLLAAALRRRGVAVAWVDPRSLVVTDARFGRARPDETAIAAAVERWVRPAVDGGEVVVTGGFVGLTPAGETTILGWESSDYTATLLGAALRADLVEIWSDVDGVFTADPRLVAGAVQVPLLSYREAADLAFFGAKVLHPATMEPVARDGVPVRIRNSFAPEREGTLVTREGAGLGIRGIAAEGDLEIPRLAELAGAVCGARLLEGPPVGPGEELVAAPGLPTGELLERLTGAPGERVAAFAGRRLALVSLVGSALPATAGRRAERVLAGVPALAVPSHGCVTHASFVVDEDLRATALGRLHGALLAGDLR